MSESDLDDDLIVAAGLQYFSRLKLMKKRRRTKRMWVNPYLAQRKTKGRFFIAVPDLRKNPSLFKENFHMSPTEFDLLLSLLEARIRPKVKTRPNDLISAEEKLCITLEFLASGTLQRHLASVYRVSKQRIGPIIEETCSQIYQVLQHKYYPELNQETWTQIKNDFHSKWNFPNCIGTIDGKHVEIKSPDNAGSTFYNYKGYHSIVLMAVADANYKFVYVDIGAYGSESDSSVFQNCEFGQAFRNKTLDIPPEQMVNGKLIPHFFLGDDAFPLHRNLMKPYKPATKNHQLEQDERIFNYRLSRARRCVENSFGVLCARWICLARSLFVNPNRAQKIVVACCALHNFMLTHSKVDYCPPGFDDTYAVDGEFIPGSWRKLISESSMMNTTLNLTNPGRPTKSATKIRNHLKEYFTSDLGSVDWQNKAIFFK